MEKKIQTFDGEDIQISYDLKRCIHARECVNGLPSVFNTKKKPWVQPDEASAEQIAEIIQKCPTGALQYEMKNDTESEKPPARNRIILQLNGPVYIHGDIEIQDADETTLLEDTRIALCRCGMSENKPLCDNTHKVIEFIADRFADTNNLPEADENNHGRIVLKLMKNGPALVEGTYTLESVDLKPHSSDKTIALCRCGGSSNKPFCDGTHKTIGFTSA
jgi:CDGSH-type Zn-finger protein/uncharacterized Fe-S cluster protein YjdI